MTLDRCVTESNCPAVFGLPNGDFAFIGKKADQKLLDDLPSGKGVGSGEALVIVPRSVVADAEMLPRREATLPLTIRTAQRLAWANKVMKGFGTTDVALEFTLLIEEVGEAIAAWRKERRTLGSELADIFLFVTALAEMNGIDLEHEVVEKIEENYHRIYDRNAKGVLIKREKAKEG